MRVSVSELKNHLSLYLHKIQEGKDIDVVVLSHRKPVARLSAIDQKKNSDIFCENIIIEYEWSGKKPKGLKHRLDLGGDIASAMVLEDRR